MYCLIYICIAINIFTVSCLVYYSLFINNGTSLNTLLSYLDTEAVVVDDDGDDDDDDGDFFLLLWSCILPLGWIARV